MLLAMRPSLLVMTLSADHIEKCQGDKIEEGNDSKCETSCVHALFVEIRNSAVNYAVSRCKGQVAAVRVIEKDGKLRSLLLVDQRLVK